MDLGAIPWRTTRYPGIRVHFYAADEATGRVLALIRMEPGCGYPRHQHRGPEQLVVLQRGYPDEQGTHPAGEFRRYEDGSTHSPVATVGAVPCVLLALAHEGVQLLGAAAPPA